MLRLKHFLRCASKIKSFFLPLKPLKVFQILVTMHRRRPLPKATTKICGKQFPKAEHGHRKSGKLFIHAVLISGFLKVSRSLSPTIIRYRIFQ